MIRLFPLPILFAREPHAAVNERALGRRRLAETNDHLVMKKEVKA